MSQQTSILRATVVLALGSIALLGCAGPSPTWFYGSWSCAGERFEGTQSIPVELTLAVDGNDDATEGTYSDGAHPGSWTRGDDGIELVPVDTDYDAPMTIDHDGTIPESASTEIDVLKPATSQSWSVEVEATDGKMVELTISDDGEGEPIAYKCQLDEK